MNPWGPLAWLLPKVGNGPWHVITSSSFEDRSLALAGWIKENRLALSGAFILKIENPPSDWWSEAEPRVAENINVLGQSFGAVPQTVLQCLLTADPAWVRSNQNFAPANAHSVILDMSTLPKRIFLFAVRELIARPTIENLVVTYAKAKVYPEVRLCRDALPPSALPGFVRTTVETKNRRRLVVGIGYTGVGVEDLVQSARETKLDFLFPFPPGSPAFRRNWTLLTRLMPIDSPSEVHRVNSLDAFEVCERIIGWSAEYDVEVVPLGPKPHALGAAMAYIKLGGAIELTYAQPQSYNPKYSEGIALDGNGHPDITGYCLKRNGVRCF